MVRHREALDVAIEDWARIMREMYGITDPRSAGGYLGAVRCTLAARRDLHHGGRSSRVDQHWPEFPFARASDDAVMVHKAVRKMPEPLAEVIVANYVPIAPKSRQLRAELLGLSRPDYYSRLERARCLIRGVLLARELSDTLGSKPG